MSKEAAVTSLSDRLMAGMHISPDMDPSEPPAEAEDLDELIEQIASEDPPTRFFGVQSLRRRVTDDFQFSYAKLVRAKKAFDVMVKSLDSDSLPDLQYECAWILNNLLTNHRYERPDLLARCDDICPALVRLLGPATPDRTREQAAWALANLAGEAARVRDRAVACGLVPALTALWEAEPSTGVLDATCLLMVNLFRDQEPRVDFECAKQLLPHMVRLLEHKHAAVAPHVVWALSYMIEESEPRMRLVLQEDILNHLRRFLTSTDEELLIPTMRVFGNISSKMNLLPSCVLADGLLTKLRPLLDHADAKIRRQVLFFVSNISDGSDSNLTKIVEAGFLPKVGSILLEADELEKREAFWIVPNLIITRGCKFKKLVIDSCLEGFFEVLSLGDPELTNCVLLTVRELLLGTIQHPEWAIDFDSVRQKIEHFGGLKKMEMVQQMGDEELAKMSYQIIKDFFWNKGQKYLSQGSEEPDDNESVEDKFQASDDEAPEAEKLPQTAAE